MPPKTKTAFFCQNCGVESPKWVGKCPSCNEWNTFVEEVIVKTNNKQTVGTNGQTPNKPQKISEIVTSEETRYDTQNGELNRVLVAA